MKQRPGHKMSAVLKSGITVNPIAVGSPGSVCKEFRIEITKRSKGKTIKIEPKDPFQTYPHKTTKESPSVWEKIEEIYNHFYNKLYEKK